MGTSASSTGPKGSSRLLPSWAEASIDTPAVDDSEVIEPSTDDSSEGEETNTEHIPTQKLSGTKSILTRITNGVKGSSFKNFAKSYIKSSGGSKAVTKASVAGISVGASYIGFLNEVSREGFNDTLEKYDLSDCIGKTGEEVIARIADRIAPIGSTNDESIARVAVMMAFDRLYEKILDSGKDIDELDNINSEMLTDTVIEFVSAYIFKKWVYEAGISLERNDLTEVEALELENEMRVFIRDEVNNEIRKKEVTELDLTQGEGRKLIENIFELAYSTLEK